MKYSQGMLTRMTKAGSMRIKKKKICKTWRIRWFRWNKEDAENIIH